MFDFIKNNKTIFSLIFIALFLLLVMFAVMMFIGGDGDNGGDNPAAFPDTTKDREIDSTTDLFGPTDAERWVNDNPDQTQAPLFRAITDVPVAGVVTFEESDGIDLNPKVRYVALNNGHVFETSLDVLGVEDKLSIENIHRIGDVAWSENGSALLTRYFGDDKNTVVHSRLGFFTVNSLESSTTDSVTNESLNLSSKQLEENITTAAFSPDGTQVFYLVEGVGGTTGYIESVKTGIRSVVWESVFKNLTVTWNTSSKILIYRNPSSVAEGIVWILDADSYEYTPLLGKELALAAKLNPTGDKLLYSLQEKKNAVFSLRVLDMESGDTMILPIEGMVDKCVWGSEEYVYCAVSKSSVNGDFLEKWYMGLAHTNDTLWRIDVRNGNIKKLLDPEEETGEAFDIVNLEVSPEEDYLVFISRVNKALWSLKLPEKVSAETEVEL